MSTSSGLLEDLLLFDHEGKQHDLRRWILPDGAKLSNILGAIAPKSKAGDKTYFRLYRRILRLKKLDLVSLYKGVSGIQYDEKPGWYVAATVHLIDLIRQVQNSNLAQTASFKDEIDPLYRIPQRCRPERIEAIKKLLSIKDHDLFVRVPVPGVQNPDPNNWQHWMLNPELPPKLWDIDAKYEEYTEEIRDRSIIFRPVDRSKNDVLQLPYRTRFTDHHRKLAALTEFEQAWEKATLNYQAAVFLTLTTAPPRGGHRSLWHVNRHFGKAWNRYTALLGKRTYLSELKNLQTAGYSPEEIEKLIDEKELGKGKRPIYIAVYEFQKNGLLHAHIVIFGRRYLERKDRISSDWQRCGQGTTVDICSLKNDRGVWNWRKEKPKDAEGKKPEAYLKKYLKKALFGSEGFSLYWSVNKRFHSMSRRLRTPKEKIPPTGYWRCLGSWKEDDIPAWVYQQQRGAPVLASWDGWETMPNLSQRESAIC